MKSFPYKFTLLALSMQSLAFSQVTNESAPESLVVAQHSSEHRRAKAFIEYEEIVIEVGGNYTYLQLNPDQLSSYSGNLGGVQFSFEYRPPDGFYEAAQFLWREGTVDGSGELERTIFDADTQIRLGMSKKICERLVATLFTGFGWRYLGQELKGLAPLDLNYNEVYIPVGLLTQYRPTNEWSVGLNGIWKPQIFPTVNFIPLDNVRWVTECTLGNFQIELPVAYRFTAWGNRAIAELKPFFEFWQDGGTLAATSEGVALGLLQNTYYFGGVQFNLGLRY